MSTPTDASIDTGGGDDGTSPGSQDAALPANHGHQHRTHSSGHNHGHSRSHKQRDDHENEDHHHSQKNRKVIVLPDGSRIIKSQKEKHLPDGSVFIKTKTESIPASSPNNGSDNKKKKHRSSLRAGKTNNNNDRSYLPGSTTSESHVVKTETRRIRPNGGSVTTTTTERIEMADVLDGSIRSMDSRDSRAREPEVLGAQTEVLPDGTRVVTSETRTVMKDGRVNVTSTVVKVVEGTKEDASSKEENGGSAEAAAVLDEAQSNQESLSDIPPAPVPRMEGHQLEIDYSGTTDDPRPPGFFTHGVDDRIQRKIQGQDAPQSSSFVPPGQSMGLEIDYSGTTSDPRPPGFDNHSIGGASGTGSGGVMSLEDRIKQKIKEEDERKSKANASQPSDGKNHEGSANKPILSYEDRVNQKIKEENRKNSERAATVGTPGLEIQRSSRNEPIPPEFAAANANVNRSAGDEKASYRRVAPPATRAGVQHVQYDGSSPSSVEKEQSATASTPASNYEKRDNNANKNTSTKYKEEMTALLDQSNDNYPTQQHLKDEETGEYYDSQKDDYSFSGAASVADKSQGAYSINANGNADSGLSKQEGGFAALSHMVRASYDHDKTKPIGGGNGGDDDLRVNIHDRRHSDKSSEYSHEDMYDKKPEDGFTKEGIAIAKAVDGDGDDDDGKPVYSAIEYDPNAKPPIYRNRRYQAYSALGLVVIAVIVTVAVVMTTQKTKEKNAANTKNFVEPSPPTMAPTTFRDVSGVKEFLERNVLFGNITFDSIVAGYVNATAGNITAGDGNSTIGNVTLGDGNSTMGNITEDITTFAELEAEDPRLVALDWILHKDAMQLEVYDDNLSQRYILGLLAVAWDSESWVHCGAVVEDDVENVEETGSTLSDKSSACTVTNNKTGLVQTYQRWLSDTDECDWYGVLCSGGYVLSIELAENNLIGEIVPELGMLPSLQIIDLSSNCIHGTIPSGIGQLTYLTNLDLKDNGLSGYVPTELFNLTNLVKLDLSYNVNYDGNCTRFDGTEKDIPISFGLEGMILDSNIGRLENLQDIDLTDNYFSGSISPDIVKLKQLARIVVDNNVFKSSVPHEITQLVNLKELWLSMNYFTGGIPENIGALKSLESFSMWGNEDLTGHIPDSLYDLTMLEDLHLFRNSFTGSISTQIGRLTKLKTLTLAENNFTGTLPTELGLCQDLEFLRIEMTDIEGSAPKEVCDLTEKNLFSDDRDTEYFKADCLEDNVTMVAFFVCDCCSSCCNHVTNQCIIMD